MMMYDVYLTGIMMDDGWWMMYEIIESGREYFQTRQSRREQPE